MSITISQQYNKFKILLSSGMRGERGISVYADNKEEMLNVVKHYYMMKHNKRKCPACKDK